MVSVPPVAVCVTPGRVAGAWVTAVGFFFALADADGVAGGVEAAPAEPPPETSGSGAPGRLLVGVTPGRESSCRVLLERTAAPSTEPITRVRPTMTVASTVPLRSTRRRRSHRVTRGPRRRQASLARWPSIE